MKKDVKLRGNHCKKIFFCKWEVVKIFEIMAETYAGQNSKCGVRNFFVNFIKYESNDGQGDPL